MRHHWAAERGGDGAAGWVEGGEWTEIRDVMHDGAQIGKDTRKQVDTHTTPPERHGRKRDRKRGLNSTHVTAPERDKEERDGKRGLNNTHTTPQDTDKDERERDRKRGTQKTRQTD